MILIAITDFYPVHMALYAEKALLCINQNI